MAPKLLITDIETGAARDYELTRQEMRIGRSADRNDIVLDNAQVSREHATLRRVGQAYMLVDLNSANGTFIDGQRIKERILKTDDVFTISKYTLTYKDQGSAIDVTYDNQPMGSTVFFRKPEQVLSSIPQIDKAAISSASITSGSLLEDIEALRKKADTLARLYELNEMLGSVFGLEEIFKKVSEMLFRLTPADRFIVLLKDKVTAELAPVAAEFRTPEMQKRAGEAMAISKTVVDRVVAERVSLLSYDAQADPRWAEAKSIILQNIQSIMCAPLIGKNGVLGVIYVDCQEFFKTFSEDDLELLNALAGGTSIAVDNAITHNQLVNEALARATFGRFMPPHVVKEILANPNALALGGSNQVVTMLFSDVRGFTTMAESLPPETVVQILNEYFADMTPIVFEYEGLLDKFMGDGMMALFGVPYQSETAAAAAVSAAVAMQRRMKKVNSDLKERGLSEISIGIGVNTGTVTVGYIGSEERTDYTAIGDAVNLAARLEKQALAWQIIISHSTLEAIGGRFPTKPSGEVVVRGRREPVQIYEVLWDAADIDMINGTRPEHASRITNGD